MGRLTMGALRAVTGPAGLILGATLGAGLAGCHHEEKSTYDSPSKAPTVQVIHPEVRTIVREIGQPSFIEAYERTSIYAKLTGYIDKWIVDIGDRVKKGEVLAKIFIPELVEDFGTKRATVGLKEQTIEKAKKVVDVAAADVRAAEARLQESQSILAKYQAEAERWDIEVKRLTREVERGVVDRQVLLESENQLKSSTADRNSAQATIRKAEAELLSYQAKLDDARVEVAVAVADLQVATSEAKRLEALTTYLTLSAPFDGVVVARNANTFDFVLPGQGDPTAMQRSPYESPSRSAAPIYVIDRTDVVRIFVDIPESDANYVRIGSAASVLAKGYRDEPINGSVTRTAWALNVKSRTLRAEIDLPNPEGQLLPGMYAYAKVTIERANIRAIPISCTTHNGDKTYCWLLQNGKAQRTEVRTGVSDGQYIELLAMGGAADKVDQPWTPPNGSEPIISGDLTTLNDGEKVDLDSSRPVQTPAPKKASEGPSAAPAKAENAQPGLNSPFGASPPRVTGRGLGNSSAPVLRSEHS